MEYLHERGIIHRDLALRNVLLDENFRCRVCDLGLSCLVNEEMDNEEDSLYFDKDGPMTRETPCSW